MRQSWSNRTPTWPVSDHCDGERFFNPEPIEHSWTDILRWWRKRKRAKWQRVTDFEPAPAPPPRSDATRITWINHATALIQTRGHNILTDPIWSDWAGPLPGLGARRFHPPGIRFADLPAIDAVLISHSHYDHLDRPTIQHLIAAHDPLFIAPLGLADWLQHAGTEHAITLDWWQSHALSPALKLHATPARHWTRRTLFDYNRSLWCGYFLRVTDKSVAADAILFAGDTGLADHFAAIRQHLGAPRFALLPIGAYEPRWLMQSRHMSPSDAVQAHQMLGAEQSICIHFGTFNLSDEGQHAPVSDLRHALAQAGLPERAFLIPAFGESVI